jgi:geranylgeranyl pyrophosphate synthase
MQKIRDILYRHIPQSPLLEAKGLSRSVEYSMLPGGSLFRAKLAYAVSQALNLSTADMEHSVASVEMFHVASLILDDLPCMDNGEIRRDKPCTHKVFGESTAILASLALINRSYALIFKSGAILDSHRRVVLTDFVESCLGLEGILNGQYLDLHFCGGENIVREIAKLKTSSLIRLPLILPAMLANSDETTIQYLESLAILWGESYQVFDDLKDQLMSADQTGKTTDRDSQLGRPNLCIEIGVKATIKHLYCLLSKSEGTIKSLRLHHDSWNCLQTFQDALNHSITPVLDNWENKAA